MTIVLPALAAAIAAVCVWLAVRIVNRRERWAKGTALGLAIVLGYPLSLYPIAWLYARDMIPQETVTRRICDFYCLPAVWVMQEGPLWAARPLYRFLSSAIPAK